MPENALAKIVYLQSRKGEAVLSDLCRTIAADFYVCREHLQELVTPSSMCDFLNALQAGMEYSARCWGKTAIPDYLSFEPNAMNERRATYNKMWFRGIVSPGGMPQETAIMITYYHAAKMMWAMVYGKRYFNDHTPPFFCVEARHGVMLNVIEECYHAVQFRQSRFPTVGGRADPLEQEIGPIIAAAIEALDMSLYARRIT